MATVIRPSVVPGRQRQDTGLLDQLIAQQLRAETIAEAREEERKRQAEAAGKAAQTFADVFEQSQTGEIDPVAAEAFLRDIISAGGTAGQGFNVLLGLEEARRTQAQDAATQEALAQLGGQFSSSNDPRQKFAGDVLTMEGVSPGTKLGILNQTGVLFPEPDDVDFKDFKVFNPEGAERTIRIPENVTDPQAYIEENMPSLVDAGFSTTKPVTQDATETQRDVSSIIQTTPLLRDNEELSEAERRSIARRIARDEGEVLDQLEGDFKRETEEGFFTFGSPKDRIMFNLARANVRTVMAEGETDIGKAANKAKRRAEQQYNNLEWLPPELAIDPSGITVQKAAAIAQFLMRDDVGAIDPIGTDEERFQQAIDLMKNRIGLDQQTIEAIRREVFRGSNTEVGAP